MHTEVHHQSFRSYLPTEQHIPFSIRFLITSSMNTGKHKKTNIQQMRITFGIQLSQQTSQWNEVLILSTEY